MKEETLKKINGLGKAGEIIARIIRVFLIIGFVGVIAGLVILLVLPKNLARIEIGTDVGVQIDLSGFKELTEEEQQQAREGLEKAMAEPDEDGGITGYEVDGSRITVHVGMNEKSFGLRSLIGPMIVSLLYIAASYVTLRFIGQLCAAFRDCRSPFDGNVILRMRNFAFSLIPWAVLSMISDSILSKTAFSVSSFGIHANLGTVLLVLLILGLCQIFRYGAELQQEHDETL